MTASEYDRGFADGYAAGLKQSEDALERLHKYMLRHAPSRGGYMFEGARAGFENGTYQDDTLSELIRRGWIVPHEDPAKGWVPVPRK